jgi:hypothetical protein
MRNRKSSCEDKQSMVVNIFLEISWWSYTLPLVDASKMTRTFVTELRLGVALVGMS